MTKTIEQMLSEAVADHEAAMRRYARLRAAGVDVSPPKPLARSIRYRYLRARLDAERSRLDAERTDDKMSGKIVRRGTIVGRR